MYSQCIYLNRAWETFISGWNSAWDCLVFNCTGREHVDVKDLFWIKQNKTRTQSSMSPLVKKDMNSSFPSQVCFSFWRLYWMHVASCACITCPPCLFSCEALSKPLYSSAIGQIILTVTMKKKSIFLNFDFLWIILLHKLVNVLLMQINLTWTNIHQEIMHWLILLTVNKYHWIISHVAGLICVFKLFYALLNKHKNTKYNFPFNFKLFVRGNERSLKPTKCF